MTIPQAIIGSAESEGWAVLPKHQHAAGHIRLQYQPRIVGGRVAMPVRMEIFGVTFYTDLLRRDIPAEEITPPFEANVRKF